VGCCAVDIAQYTSILTRESNEGSQPFVFAQSTPSFLAGQILAVQGILPQVTGTWFAFGTDQDIEETAPVFDPGERDALFLFAYGDVFANSSPALTTHALSQDWAPLGLTQGEGLRLSTAWSHLDGRPASQPIPYPGVATNVGNRQWSSLLIRLENNPTP
jgi:hypothetical protein